MRSLSARFAISVSLMMLVLIASPSSSLGQNSVTSSTTSANQSQLPDPTAPGTSFATRLKKHTLANDAALIEQRENNTGTHVCRAVTNSSKNDIFVPWRTAKEWAAFLESARNGPLAKSGVSVVNSVTGLDQYCCAPAQVTLCQGEPPVFLGFRTLGIGQVRDPDTSSVPNPLLTLTELGNAQNPGSTTFNPPTLASSTATDGSLKSWGANGDTYGPLYTSKSGADLEVTYVCSGSPAGGTWILSHSVGSCTPTQGSCATPGPLTTAPTDLQTLCGPGSIFDSTYGLQLSPDGTTYSWQCLGTPNYSATAGSVCGAGTTLNPATGSCDASCSTPHELNANGVCGSANNSSPLSAPADPAGTTGVLCQTGQPTVVVDTSGNGSGPWTWTCLGTGTGASAICHTNGAAACGVYAAGGTTTGIDFHQLITAFTVNPNDPGFCNPGTLTSPTFLGVGIGAQAIAGSWNCVSTSGSGSSVLCPVINSSVDGDCGSASSTAGGPAYASLPISVLNLLCHNANSTQEQLDPAYINSTTGDVTLDPVTDHWEWRCLGLGSGAESPLCWAPYSPNASAGQCAQNTTTFTSTTIPPASQLCAPPSTLDAPPVLDGTEWRWTCDGVAGGASIQCSAYDPNPPGQCGSYYTASNHFNANPPLSPSTSGLCSAGTVTNFTTDLTNFVQTWGCSTANGDSSQCIAYIPGYCGSANTGYVSTTSLSASQLCSSGIAGPVVGPEPNWQGVLYLEWNCLGYGGSSGCQAQYTPSTAPLASCGLAANVATSTTPTANYCGAGSTLVPGSLTGLSNGWNWTCGDPTDNSTITCSAPMPGAISATCGSASTGGQSYTSAGAVVAAGLCSDNSSPTVNIDPTYKNWTWTCGTSTTCTAPVTAVGGVCGLDNGITLPNNPAGVNLCAAGAANPNPPTGAGPWSWVCKGLGGAPDSPPCAAGVETACAGVSGPTANPISQSRQVTVGLPLFCAAVTVTASWNEIDNMGGGNNSAYTVRWMDSIGGGSLMQTTSVPSITPPYASPCGTSLNSITNFQETITGHIGFNCPRSLNPTDVTAQ